MKLKNKFKYISAVLLASTMGMTSCDYLDVVPPEQPNLPDATSSYDRTLGFLYSCYAGTDVELPGAYLSEITSSTDELTLPYSWNADGKWCDYATNNATATNQTWLWGTTYQYIGQCLLFQKELQNLNASFVTENDKKLWMAETKFLIAYYHFATLRRYGPIPITDSYIAMDSPSATYKGRYHFDYCVKWISDLLDEAAADLPAIRTATNEWGRATSTICKAVKARLLLYAASPLWNGSFPYPDWKNKDFETPGYGKSLVSTTYDPKKWDTALAACLEALDLAKGAGERELYDDTEFYARQGLSLPYVPGISDSDLPEEQKTEFLKNVMKMRYAVSTKESEGNKEIIWGLSKQISFTALYPHRILKTSSGTWSSGWSGVGPTLYTMEHFYTADGKLPEKDPNFTAESEWFKSANVAGRGDIIKLNVGREPRFYAWMAFDGGDYGVVFAGGSPLKLEMRNGELHGYNQSLFNRDNSPTGFLSQKFVDPNFQYLKAGGSSGATASPTILFRLAELYLNVAECYAAKGDVANAIKYLNPVRERAGIADLTPNDVNSSMNITDWVRNERFIELWDEGQRFYDVRRWAEGDKYFGAGVRKGLNAGVLNPTFEQFNKPTVLPHPYVWTNRMYLNPVFYNEVYKNPQMVQAPGY